jgi:hypothetical protein
LVFGVAGWLLLRREAAADYALVVVGVLLLVGGVADVVGVPALLVGAIVGVACRATSGVIREAVHQRAHRLRRPLVAILLVMSAARIDIGAISVLLGLSYALLILAGTWLASKTTAVRSPSLHLLGVVAAVAAWRAGGDALKTAAAVVVLGTLVAESVAVLAGPRAPGEGRHELAVQPPAGIGEQTA